MVDPIVGIMVGMNNRFDFENLGIRVWITDPSSGIVILCFVAVYLNRDDSRGDSSRPITVFLDCVTIPGNGLSSI